ncbi:Ig-like domain-containing protein [Vibrio ouci]|uniref:BIG2 domain-containing protein n=1 Tax=Vibrio ouci TaxID=2499078 RepID=A0A4Y8WL71_9VIBR|nr:Ig-like domain-containing protein [Vibrio ouci]TFH93662.1 hypothetical protein ELS82_01500 [Vibrio ouci]
MYRTLVFACLLSVLAGCGGGGGDSTSGNSNGETGSTASSGVAHIELTSASPSIPVGLSVTYQAKATYADGSVADITDDPALTWSSSDVNVATFMQGGVARGVGVGEATLSVSGVFDGEEVSATTHIIINNEEIASIQVLPENPSIAVGFTQPLTVNAILTDGSIVDVTADPALNWSSSDENVATIESATGIVNALNVGEATVHIEGEIAGYAVNETFTVVVNDDTVSELNITPSSIDVPVGMTQSFSASVTLTSGKVVDAAMMPSLRWSSDANVVSIDSMTGVASAESLGTAIITASGSAGGINISATASMTVNASSVQSLSVTPNNVSIPVGLVQTFTAQAHFSNGSSTDISQLPSYSWSSDDPTTVHIDSKTGVATALSEGRVTITAQGEVAGIIVTNSASVIVTPSVVTALNLTSTITSIPVGFAQKLTVEASLSDGSTQDVTYDRLTWSSSHNSIAAVNTTEKSILGLKPGLVTASVVGVYDNTEFSSSLDMTVSNTQFSVLATDVQYFGFGGAKYYALPAELAFPDTVNPTGVQLSDLHQHFGIQDFTGQLSELTNGDTLYIDVSIDASNSTAGRDLILSAHIIDTMEGATAIILPMSCNSTSCNASYVWDQGSASPYDALIFKSNALDPVNGPVESIVYQQIDYRVE